MGSFIYYAIMGTLAETIVPGFPQTKRYRFYTWGSSLPEGVPRKANPRAQDINKPLYLKVAESYRDRTQQIFHLKNHGITTLVSSISRIAAPTGWEQMIVALKAEIPPELGIVDGAHTTDIIHANKQFNPDQMVEVTLTVALPTSVMTSVAEGLNTSVQVTSAGMADYLEYFEPLKRYLQSRPYYQWIGWQQNQLNISANYRTIMSLMWVCNSTLYGNSEKSPSWVFTRGQAVFEKGFLKSKNETLRKQMLKTQLIMPDLIDIFIRLNELAPLLAPKKGRKSRSNITTADGERTLEVNISTLCVKSKILTFRDPSLVGPHLMLRESYLMVVMSGLRSLMQENPNTGMLEWVVPLEEVNRIVDGCYKQILISMVKQLKFDRKDHNKTPKNPVLWENAAQVMGKALSESTYPRQPQFTPGPKVKP